MPSARSVTAERLAARRILTVTEEELQRIILDIHDGPDRFGASAPFQTIYRELGFTTEAVAEAALKPAGEHR